MVLPIEDSRFPQQFFNCLRKPFAWRIHVLAEGGDVHECGSLVECDGFRLAAAGLEHQPVQAEIPRLALERGEHGPAHPVAPRLRPHVD